MMKRLALLLTVCCLPLISNAQEVNKTKLGVRVNPSGSDCATEIQLITPTAVRVMKYPKDLKEAPAHKSYSILDLGVKEQKFEVNSTFDVETLTIGNLKVTIDKQNGKVAFFSADGKPLLKETTSAMSPIESGVDKGLYKASQTWKLDDEEIIIGLGQRNQSSLNQRGQTVDIWTGNANITIPYFTSVKGYGLYWDNAGESKFVDNGEGTTFSSSAAPLEDYYFLYKDGTQDGVVETIRTITGNATMFPLWAMGYWQCRERYKTSDELCEVLDKYRELQVPLDGIVQDWQYWGCDSNWNAMKFMNPYYINKVGDPDWERYLPDDLKNLPVKEPRIKSPQEMIDYVHNNHAHLMISIWANFGPWTDQYKELDKIGALYPFDTWPRNRGVKPYDPFNPQARDIYWKYLKNLYKMGFDAWWTDSTEPDHFEREGDRDYLTHDGSYRSVKNAFPLMTNRGIYEHQRKEKGNTKRSLQMTRCGTFGIQHYGTFSWSGDINSDWRTMSRQVPTGLNYVACGIPFWNTDLGGFFGWDFNNDPKSPAMQELQVRWMQWGTFMPLMRNHCSSPMVNEIWRFGEPGYWAYDVQKQYIELRYRLLPYIYSNAADCALGCGTMMRPLMFDYPNDRRAIELNDQYIFGRNLLVKPVTRPLYTFKDEHKNGHAIYPDLKQAAAPIDVYLPAGNDWFDFWNNTRYEGGRQIQRLAPIDIMPVFVKAGTILPWGPAVQYSDEKPWDNLDIRIYPGKDGTFTLYEDEGDTYNYEKGAYTQITFTWDDAAKTLTIADRTGKYKGMIESRSFNIQLIGTNTTKTINYNGKQQTVKF